VANAARDATWVAVGGKLGASPPRSSRSRAGPLLDPVPSVLGVGAPFAIDVGVLNPSG
jgi:hypothetical protein